MRLKKLDIRFTDACIYIDKHIREPGQEEICFEYIYHIYHTLAARQKFFHNPKDYSEYSFYSATQLFLRYQKEKTNPDLKPVKSVLNYAKRTLYPFKVNYQKANFTEVFRKESLKGSLPEGVLKIMSSPIRSINNSMLQVDYWYCLGQIKYTIKKILEESPYKSDKVEIHNIYLSCCLTLLKMITLSYKNGNRIQYKVSRVLPTDDVIEQAYADESQEDVVLFHLDPSMYNYILLLVTKIKKLMAEDLSYLIGSYDLSDEDIQLILSDPIKEVYEDINESEQQ